MKIGTRQSAILTRAMLDRQRGAFERFSALAVLFFSFVGTVAAFSGGWTALVDAPHIAPIVGGLAVQTVLTAAQWWYGAKRGPWRYRIALLIDTGLTTAGYGPLIVPWLGAYFTTRGAGELGEPIAWVVTALLAAGIAWYPEQTLIDD